MSAGDWLALFGDALVLAGLLLTYVFYLGERASSDQRDIDSVLSMMMATRTGIRPWGDLYFAEGYDEPHASGKAKKSSTALWRATTGRGVQGTRLSTTWCSGVMGELRAVNSPL